jgi:TniQ
MSMTVSPAFSVRILSPWTESQEIFHESDIPARSRLYRLEPQAMGSLWQESFTSYLNRLGWMHHISPRAMVRQEIIPHLNKAQEVPHQWLGALSREYATSINGTGALAQEWSHVLEQLTRRSDLHLLTFHGWIGNLTSPGHLRAYPAWCPLCYAEWREKNLGIYQPLYWFVKVITGCPTHHIPLESSCPHCQKTQSVIALQTQPGHCTQCNRWLGTSPGETGPQPMQEEPTHWQQWVLLALEELHTASLTSSLPQWETFFTHLARGFAPVIDVIGWKKIEVFTGVKLEVFKEWFDQKRIPSLETILKLCYVCEITPFQVMQGETSSLIGTFQRGVTSRPPLHRRVRPKIDQERCLQLIHAVLNGQEEPLGLRQLGERLGCSVRILLYYFREECALITQQAREYRKQQIEQRMLETREKVRQQVLSLHAQGIYPSHHKVRDLLPPGLMRQSTAGEAWHATLHELGLEPR